MDCLTRVGYDIEISLRPEKAGIGPWVLTAASVKHQVVGYWR